MTERTLQGDGVRLTRRFHLVDYIIYVDLASQIQRVPLISSNEDTAFEPSRSIVAFGSCLESYENQRTKRIKTVLYASISVSRRLGLFHTYQG